MKNSLSKVAKMIVDVQNGSFEAYSADNSAKVNLAIRSKFNELLPVPMANGKFKYRDLMKALPEVFAIIEEVLDTTISEAWRSDPFYRDLVDSRNLALGDRNEFVIEDDTWVTVNQFSGNTWDTAREKLSGRRKISLDTKWWFAHVYDDFERFRVGAINVETLLTKMTEAFIRCVDSMIATVFNDAANNLPAAFSIAASLSTVEMRELIQKVRVASGKNIRIMGTEMATAHLNELQEIKYSKQMMRELHSTGRLGKWMGHTVVEIPQTFIPGTFDWAVDNDFLLVVPDNDKFIKFVDEGETRSQENTEDDNHDQTLSWQVQRKMGAGAIFGSKFGKYTIV